METPTTSLVLFITLIANSFSKIMLMLLGVIIAFLAIPQTRAAAMLGVAVISAFAGGILIQLYQAEQSWVDSLAMSLSFGVGLFVYPFLAIFKKFNTLINQDNEIAEVLFDGFKRLLKKFIGSNTPPAPPAQ